MKNNFFEPIELPDPPVDEQSADKSVPNWPSPKQLEPVLNRISLEIDKIVNGTSEFTPYGIMLDSDPSFGGVWDRFKNDPTKKNMDSFLEIVGENVNSRAKKEISDWLNTVIRRNNER